MAKSSKKKEKVQKQVYTGVGDPDLNQRMAKKLEKRARRKNKLADKIDMYDMIIANLIAGKAVIEPTKKLGSSQIAIGFSNIASETSISKYFLIRQLPDYLQPRLIDFIRSRCVRPGIKINFSMYGNPYKIAWDSAEMKNKMRIWKNYTKDDGPIDVFDYRSLRTEDLAKRRIVMSTRYLNDAELNHKRSLIRVAFMIEITANRDNESILNMMDTIKDMQELCSQSDIKIRELRINMIDWIQTLGPFCLKQNRGISPKIPYKILTDDVLANFNSYKQGRVGLDGACLGLDVRSNQPVLRKFKEDPDAADNWLISAWTGGGKSYWIKVLLTYLLAEKFVVTVMDYEGDEYTNLAAYIREANPEDVKVISMGKGSTTYFDPCEIPDLTGDSDVDDELKETAVSYILAIFRVIIAGTKGTLTQWEERVLSMAIQRMYDSSGVTEDKNTWYRSKGLRISMVYDEICEIVNSKELVDDSSDNIKHKAAVKIQDAAAVYFNEGETKAGTFRHPMPASSLYDAKFVVFSFGMRGQGNSVTDPNILALKQLSVALVSSQISNHCKYVKHCFNVKVWEEFQRWGEIEGSSEIISNAMTGGRKRGDVNFIITNDLANMLNENNEVSKKLRSNIQNYAIGKVPDKDLRADFCRLFDLQDCLPALDKIAKAHSAEKVNTASNSGTGSRYKNSFCVILENGKKAVVKAMIPPALLNSQLFKTGVDITKALGADNIADDDIEENG